MKWKFLYWYHGLNELGWKEREKGASLSGLMHRSCPSCSCSLRECDERLALQHAHQLLPVITVAEDLAQVGRAALLIANPRTSSARNALD